MSNTEKNQENVTIAKLRKKATEIVRKTQKYEDNTKSLSKNEVIDVIHELKVHQIELEMQNEELLRSQMDLDEARERYFELYDLAPVGYMIISERGSIIESNLTAAKELGIETREILNQKITNFIYEEDRDKYYFYCQALFSSHEQQDCELRMRRMDGSTFWAHLKSILISFKEKPTCRLIISDISEQKRIEQILVESEEKFRLICTSMEQGLALFEMKAPVNRQLHAESDVTDQRVNEAYVDFTYLEINDSYSKFFNITKEMAVGKSMREVLPTIKEKWMCLFETVAKTQEPKYFESYYPLTEKHYGTYAYSPKKNQLALLITDTTERVNRLKEIYHMNYHDRLTGLYNRRFFEEELRRLDTDRSLPLTLVMGDINGLKLVNDSFGHKTGDILLKKVADLIKEGCRADDIIARISGDEFVIILPNSDTEETIRLIDRIQKLAEAETIESIKISIAFGFDTKNTVDEDVDVILKRAEDFMYRHKLYESASIKSKLIDLIMVTLFEKNNRELLHSKRVGDISEKIAIAMKYNTEQVSQIRLAGLMHDIGKIGVAEKVLNEKEMLSKEEWKELKRHSEIGYRILSSSNEFSEIASIILEHHERWDGQGYPKGIKGDAITIPARVIAISDTYDAMTRERTYKKSLSKKEAITEIVRGKYTQFDPEIVDVFIENVVQSL